MGNNQTGPTLELPNYFFPGRLSPHLFIVNDAEFKHTKTEFQPLLSSLSIHSEQLVIMEDGLESQISLSQRRGVHQALPAALQVKH